MGYRRSSLLEASSTVKRGTLVVGDVHGCADELEHLLELAGDVKVVLVGDLFTKGPDPARTWSLIKKRKAKAVLGNHDWRLLRVLDGERRFDQHGTQVCAALDAADPDWRGWLRKVPLHRRRGGFLITHAALHPSGKLGKTDRFTHLLRRRWPGDNQSDSPPWWQAYKGPPVIFGHDAKQGLLLERKNGEPWLVGLDTGCVYGGQLSGWLIEEGALIQVPARRVYRKIG